MIIDDMGSSTAYLDPTWIGDGFAEEVPQKLWLRMPETLRIIALEEVLQGNKIIEILENRENRERIIILLGFSEGPMVSRDENESLRIHTNHKYGNYCYDGTKATYEDLNNGCFLAFDDPNYVEDDAH